MIHEIPGSDVSFATVNGIEMAYETFGFNNHPAILLIMGLGVQMVVWDEEFCKRLAARGYFVIRFDNRDAGLSSNLAGAGVPNISEITALQSVGTKLGVPYTLEDMADDTVGLMDSLSIDSAHIVGLSMGGMIGQVMGLRYPKRVRTLTLVMSSTGNPNLPPPKPEAMSVLMLPIPAERSAYIQGWLNVWKVLSGPKMPVGGSLGRKWAELSHDRGINPDGFLRQMAAIVASGNRKEALKNLSVPTLVIHGDSDPLLSIDYGIDTADSIPGAKLCIIEGMGHTLPEALWNRVIETVAAHAI